MAAGIPLVPLQVSAQLAALPVEPRYEPAKVRVELERKGCMDSACRVYRISIDGNGRVEYTGIRSVAVEGKRTREIDPAHVVGLVNEFLRARFFDALNEYDEVEQVARIEDHLVFVNEVKTDLPWFVLSLKLGDRTKTVRLRDHYPAELGSLAEAVDRTAEVQSWAAARK
jgi:hypothetical protein